MRQSTYDRVKRVGKMAVADAATTDGAQRGINVLISSIGRRGYLARWFREALRSRGNNGLVYAADASPHAPGLADADGAITLPPFTAPNYHETLKATLARYDIRLALSVNDHELSIWSQAHEFLAETTTLVVALAPGTQSLVADKLATARALAAAGIASPRTLLAANYVADPASAAGLDDIILKHRFGSGSLGMMACRVTDLPALLPYAARDVRDREGRRVNSVDDAYGALIIQERVHGDEYGIDVVNDFSRTFEGVLARRKLRMRAGETDAVETAAPEPFQELGRAISTVLDHRGPVDVDIIVSDGKSYVIDMNPRFGGGYPFSHAAGADLPAACIAWTLGEGTPAGALTYTVGLVGAKQDCVVITDMDGERG